jgi:hypothetical protein
MTTHLMGGSFLFAPSADFTSATWLSGRGLLQINICRRRNFDYQVSTQVSTSPSNCLTVRVSAGSTTENLRKLGGKKEKRRLRRRFSFFPPSKSDARWSSLPRPKQLQAQHLKSYLYSDPNLPTMYICRRKNTTHISLSFANFPCKQSRLLK